MFSRGSASGSIAVSIVIVVLLCALLSCGHDEKGEKEHEIPPTPFIAYSGPTAWDDFLAAEQQVRTGTFSSAYLFYKSAIEKLTNDTPLDDGPCSPGTLNSARYGASFMLLTIPARIIEGFLDSWASGDNNAVADFLIEWYRETTGEENPPISLITDYMREIILPLLDQSIDWIDNVMSDSSFSYRMPEIKIELFSQAFVIPDVAIDGRGEHDLGEAALVSWILHLARYLCRSIYAYNLDINAANIDAILQIFLSGNFEELFKVVYEYPNFLKLRRDDESGIDGEAELKEAKKDFVAVFDLIKDDDNDDGIYSGNFELPDDFQDVVLAETDDQLDDIVRYNQGHFSCNIRINGKPADELGCGKLLDALFLVLSDKLMESITHATHGTYPPEQNPRNGFDDDIGTGFVSKIEKSTMTDFSSSWVPGSLKGYILNPSVFRVLVTGENKTFVIVGNSTNTVTVDGNLEEIAYTGDFYSIGDGEIDDAPMDISLIVAILLHPSWPQNATLGILPSAFFDLAPDARDFFPAWNPEIGDPDFFKIVVDRTESFEDKDGDGLYNPEVDVLHDAPHSYGQWSYNEDGLYQPYYMFFPDPTISEWFQFGGTLEDAQPNDAMNLLISQLVSRLSTKATERNK